ncbi:MAG: DUF190 domain-containing protein, partial [Pseudomonadota bacterium]
MQRVCLKLFMTEAQKHGSELLYEWLLEKAKKSGIPGGSAFRAIAGYGRHGRMHEETFFELAGDLPLEVEFVLSEEQAQAFLDALAAENLHLVYIKT